MFGLLIMGLLGGGAWMWVARSEGHPVPPPAVLLAVASALALAAVVAQMLRHPHGVKDWIQGGVVDVTTDPRGRLAWLDWAIAITRQGSLDPQSGYVKLERRLLFGLIPIGQVLRPIREFYRVEVQAEPRYARRNRRRSSLLSAFDGDDQRLVGYTYTVTLVDRRGDRLCVLDLAAGTGRQEEEFIGHLRQRLEEVVGRAGEAAPPAPRDDEFEAWRKKKAPPTA